MGRTFVDEAYFNDLDEEAAEQLEAEWATGDMTPNQYAKRWQEIWGGKEGFDEDGNSLGNLADSYEGELVFDFGELECTCDDPTCPRKNEGRAMIENERGEWEPLEEDEPAPTGSDTPKRILH